MSHGPQAFKKTDVARACRAVQAAGLEIARVEVSKDGTITVVPGKPSEVKSSDDDLDQWIAKNKQCV